MDKAQVRIVANDLLGLNLSEGEAAALIGPLDGLRKLVELIDRVPLAYSSLPFVTPATGDRWLEKWPEAGCPIAANGAHRE